MKRYSEKFGMTGAKGCARSCMISFAQRRLLTLVVFAAGAAICAGQSKASATKSVDAGRDGQSRAAADKKAGAAADEKAKKTQRSAAGTGTKKLVEQLNAQRDAMITNYDALAKRLKDASAEQKKAILEEMQRKKRDFEQVQSALHKQIRDEHRRQRQNAAGKR